MIDIQHKSTLRCAEYRDYLNVMLSVIRLNVVTLHVVMLHKVMLNVIMLHVVMLHVIMLHIGNDIICKFCKLV